MQKYTARYYASVCDILCNRLAITTKATLALSACICVRVGAVLLFDILYINVRRVCVVGFGIHVYNPHSIHTHTQKPCLQMQTFSSSPQTLHIHTHTHT